MSSPLLLGAGVAALIPALDLPTERLAEIGWFDVLLAYPPLKALLPIPILALLAPLVIWFFGGTWKKLDAEARADWSRPRGVAPQPDERRSAAPRPRVRSRGLAPSRRRRPRGARVRLHLLAHRAQGAEKRSSAGRGYDYRPAVCLVVLAVVLTIQEYYGGRQFYNDMVRPWLQELEAGGARWLNLAKYDELWSYGWWSFARVAGYVLVPFPLWKLLFPRDSLLDMGLRLRGLSSHVWIYALCLAVVLPAMVIVASQPDFGGYYPFYKMSSRSWFDLLAWEAIYFAQFLALEMFFRGWILGALRRSIGAAAIFVMAVPYCMIHYGKPYLETHGAIVAGIVLGSLAMHTRSIYSGFLVHITVAFLMDFLSLWKRGGLPTQWFAP